MPDQQEVPRVAEGAPDFLLPPPEPPHPTLYATLNLCAIPHLKKVLGGLEGSQLNLKTRASSSIPVRDINQDLTLLVPNLVRKLVKHASRLPYNLRGGQYYHLHHTGPPAWFYTNAKLCTCLHPPSGWTRAVVELPTQGGGLFFEVLQGEVYKEILPLFSQTQQHCPLRTCSVPAISLTLSTEIQSSAYPAADF